MHCAESYVSISCCVYTIWLHATEVTTLGTYDDQGGLLQNSRGVGVRDYA